MLTVRLQGSAASCLTSAGGQGHVRLGRPPFPDGAQAAQMVCPSSISSVTRAIATAGA